MKSCTLAQKLSVLILATFIGPFWHEGTASAQQPIPATFFGMDWNTVGSSHIPSVPFGAIRLWDTGTSWRDLQPSNSNSFWWTPLDNWLAQAGNHDVLYTFGKVPTWAGGTNSPNFGNVPNDFNSGNTSWKKFVTNLVQHSLASTTAHIKYYELWNEPDLSYWLGSTNQLAVMSQQAYTIIHSLDTNAVVVGPSPSSASSLGWITGYWSAGGATCQDIVGYHLYLYSNGDFPGNPQSALGYIDNLKSLMAQFNIGTKPIWYTEGSWGDQTHPPVAAMTNDDRVAYLAQDYLFLWSKGVARYYWYSWDNPDWGTLWSSSGGVNPMGIAYGQLYNWLVGSMADSTNACTKAADNTWTAKLSLSNSYQAQIIWNATTQKSITVGANFTYYQTLDDATEHSIVSNSVAIGKKPILIVAPQPVNLALNCPVTVSSSSSSSYAGTNAVDGNLTSRWSSAYSNDEWIYVDLGAVIPVTGVTLFWQNAHASSYKIQVSTNATTWTDVYSTTTSAGGTERISFSANARYVKMLGIQRATVYGYSLWEFQVFGVVPQPVNLALNQPVTASSAYSSTYAATNAVDGNLATRWSSLYTDSEWIYVDLGGVIPITAVTLAWQNAHASSYKIQVSNNATSWTDVFSTTNGVGGTETIRFSSNARYVRMFGIKRATVYGYSLWEFQVFGNGYTPLTGAVYQLISVKSNMALDNNSSTANGTPVMQWTQQSGDGSQLWQLSDVGSGYYQLICLNSGKALDNGGSTTAGTTNTQWTASTGNTNQHWRFAGVPGGYYNVISQKSNMAMDNGGSTTAGTPITQYYTQSGNTNQYWQLQYR